MVRLTEEVSSRRKPDAWELPFEMALMGVMTLLVTGLLALITDGRFRPDWGLSFALLFVPVGVHYGQRLRRHWRD